MGLTVAGFVGGVFWLFVAWPWAKDNTIISNPDKTYFIYLPLILEHKDRLRFLQKLPQRLQKIHPVWGEDES